MSNDNDLDVKGLEAAGRAIAADTRLGEMHRSSDIAAKAIRAYLQAPAPADVSGLVHFDGATMTPAAAANRLAELSATVARMTAERDEAQRNVLKMCAAEITAVQERKGAEAKVAALTEALEPSAETKAAYIGEFTIAVERRWDEDGEADDAGGADPYEHIQVPWTTIKEIMAAIRDRALQAHKGDRT